METKSNHQKEHRRSNLARERRKDPPETDASFRIGPYVPGGGASVLREIGAEGGAILEIFPAFWARSCGSESGSSPSKTRKRRIRLRALIPAKNLPHLEAALTQTFQKGEDATPIPVTHSEVILHFSGLEPGQSSWFYNRKGGVVPVFPGEFVRLNLARHPEVAACVKSGVAVIRKNVPAGEEILDENTDPRRDRTIAESKRLERSAGMPDVLSLAEEELNRLATCLLPWPGWEKDLEGVIGVSDGRLSQRGIETDVLLPDLLQKNFLFLHRIGELRTRKHIENTKKLREGKIQASWEFGEYESMAECREAVERALNRSKPIPKRMVLLNQYLSEWKVWGKAHPPSAATLNRHRKSLSAFLPTREFIDIQLHELHLKPCQRIYL